MTVSRIEGPYHRGELEVQQRAGVQTRAAELADSIHDQLPLSLGSYLARRRMLLVAARDRSGAVWCLPLTGAPPFVRVLDARTLQITALEPVGHPLFAALASPRPVPVGLLALDFATRRRVRINGRGGVLDGVLYVRVEQAYTNCRKYVSRRLPPADGVGAAPAAEAPRVRLDDVDRALVAAADTFFIGSVAGEGADASHRGGRPGVVTVLDDVRLAWADYTGNSMFNTLGNLALDPSCGLAFVDFASGEALTLTGTATVDWNPARAAGVAGAERIVDFAVGHVVRVRGAIPGGWTLEDHSVASPQPTPVARHP